ncbi:hypothetical protein TNCV_4865811 [Trichonephila clavipes]|nr:hypothetical protein TNCV_4865811 [Trichonephila clavipes]
MTVSSNFSPGENSTRVTSSGTFQLISEKNTPQFLWCPRLMFSIPQYPFFAAGCNQRDVPDWTPDIKALFCTTAVDRMPGNSSSRHNSKVTNNLRSHCPPML